MKKKIAITGLSGVIGKGLLSMFPAENWDVIDLFHTSPSYKSKNIQSIKVNLLNDSEVQTALETSKPDYILHMAAATHIDECQKDKIHGKNGKVWKLNVEATKSIITAAKKIGSTVVYLSTESVFGQSKQSCPLEMATRNPVSWYGFTKAVAEEEVIELGDRGVILRSVVAYSLDRSIPTIYAQMANEFLKGENWFAVTDQYFTPTVINDIQNGIYQTLARDLQGVIHIVNPQLITPYHFAKKIAKHLGYDEDLVLPKTLEEYFGLQRAGYRLRYACLDATLSSKKLGFTPQTIDEVLFKENA